MNDRDKSESVCERTVKRVRLIESKKLKVREWRCKGDLRYWK